MVWINEKLKSIRAGIKKFSGPIPYFSVRNSLQDLIADDM